MLSDNSFTLFLKAKIKYAVGSDRILDVDITSELSLIKINVNKNCVSSFMSAVNSLLWCLQYSTMQQNGNTDGNSADKSTDSDSEDENDSGTGEDLTLSESVLTKSENALDESMVTAKDEYLNTLKKEYAEAESLFSDDSMSSGVLPTMHVMLKMDQFVFNVEGVIRLEVHKVAACGLVESEFTGALNASGGGGSGEPSMTGSLLGSTYTVEFSLGNVSLYSLVPSA